jgi:hypothetical protein
MTQTFVGDWPVRYSGSNCYVFEGAPDEKMQELYESVAIELLWNWTGRVFGTATDDVRPARSPIPRINLQSSFEGAGPYPFNPGFGSGRSSVRFEGGGGSGSVMGGGSWLPILFAGFGLGDILCGSCGNQQCYCEPSRINTIHLPGPIVEINSVTIDGVDLVPTAYRLDNKRWLIRQDGNPWPLVNNLDLDTTQVGTWKVNYVRGIPVPIGGQVAAGILACEFAKAAMNDANCALPSRVQTITREGVTIGIIDSFADISKGATGIWAIDSWTQACIQPRKYSSVHSVDTQGTKSWQY